MSLTPAMIQELHNLENVYGNLLTIDVIERAQDPTSALHNYPSFDWDVTSAAYKYNMNAARQVIQVYVKIVNDLGTDKIMRSYVHIRDTVRDPIYRPTELVLQENRATIINIVCDRIISVIKSYPLHEFDPVIDLVEQIRAAAMAPPPSTGRGRRGRRGGQPPQLSV